MTDTYTYDAYGTLIGSTGTTTNEFLYAGYQTDAATGLDYLRARYYNPELGQFTSRDSYEGDASTPLSRNPYVYATASPVDNIDPSGHFSLGEVLSVATIGVSTSFAFFSLINIGNEAVSGNNKQFASGIGGYSADLILANLKADVTTRWNNLNTSQKTSLINYLHGPSSGLSAWDITELAFEQKYRWSDDPNGVPGTVTYQGHVYAASEVNYVLWGLIQGLAYKDGIEPSKTSATATAGWVALYRGGLGGWLVFGNLLNHRSDKFETIQGKIAWATYGWSWVFDANPPAPIEADLPNVVGNPDPWPSYLQYHAGDHYGSGAEVSGIVQ